MAVTVASIAIADYPLPLAYIHLLGVKGETNQVAYTGFLAFSATLTSSIYLSVGGTGRERFVL